MAEVQIFLNGEPRSIPAEADLDRLLDIFSLPRQRVAVELNHTVVRRADWAATTVREGDKLEVVHFVGGG